MLRQIRLLLHIQMANTLGFNEMRFSKDTKRGWRQLGMLLVYIMVGVFIGGYSGLLTYGCVLIGAGHALVSYLVTIFAAVTLFFTIYKAGSLLFESSSFEMLLSLPIQPAAIVCSRFLSMYIKNLGFGALLFGPAAVVYGISAHPGPYFYLVMVLGFLFAPLLPMVIGTAVGALITAISARMKHKNLISLLLSACALVLFFVFYLRAMQGASELSTDDIRNLVGAMTNQLSAIYPPSAWFLTGSGRHPLFLLLFVLASFLLFVALALVIARYFFRVSAALKSHAAASNYKMEALTGGSVFAALYRRERKRYFSSSIYVLNTTFGYLFALLLSAGLILIGEDKLSSFLGLPGIAPMVPFICALFFSISPSTAVSISMEGKQWWLIKCLPVSARQIANSKIAITLTFALPCWLVSSVLFLIALDAPARTKFFIVLIPLVCLLFSSVLGLAVNLSVPNFTWSAEVEAVKQGASLLITLMIGMFAGIVCGLLSIFIQSTTGTLLLGAWLLLLLVVGALLYRKVIHTDLRRIG